VAATLSNVPLAFVPIELIAVKHTITIKASITAYSTAVGPSSQTRNRRNFKASDFINIPPFQFSCPKKILERKKVLGSLGQ
jgi:hypothetical protein